MYKRKKDIFNQPTEDAARHVILTNYAGFTCEERWEVETVEEVAALKNLIPKKARVCDFGIGIGRISKGLLEEMPGINILGVESCDKMLEYSKVYVPKKLQKRLELVRYGDIGDIKTNSVDFAFAIYVLQHIPSEGLESAVLELNRIIKPEGSLYLLNTDKFRAVPMGNPTWYNDRFPQWKVIHKQFDEIKEVEYDSDYMKTILKTHQSKLFRPKK